MLCCLILKYITRFHAISMKIKHLPLNMIQGQSSIKLKTQKGEENSGIEIKSVLNGCKLQKSYKNLPTHQKRENDDFHGNMNTDASPLPLIKYSITKSEVNFR